MEPEPLTLSDNLWKLIYLVTKVLSDFIEFIGALQINWSIYLSAYLTNITNHVTSETLIRALALDQFLDLALQIWIWPCLGLQGQYCYDFNSNYNFCSCNL